MIKNSQEIIFHSLHPRSCPAHLEAGLTRAVLDEARANYLNHNTTSMSPTGGTTGETDGTKIDKFASSEDLNPAQPSLTSTATSTKGSQGKNAGNIVCSFYCLTKSLYNKLNLIIALFSLFL